MELSDLRIALRRHWLIALAVFLVCVAMGVAAARLPTKQYEATSVLLVLPLGGSEASAANFIAPSYVALLTSDALRDDAEPNVPLSYRLTPISVAAEHATGTGVITLSVTSPSPGAAASWANALPEQLIENEARAASLYAQQVAAAEQQQLSADAASDAGLPPPITVPVEIPPHRCR